MLKKKLIVPVLALGLLVSAPITNVYADTLLTTEMKAELTKSTTDLKDTAGEVLVLLTTASLGLWGMSFPVKKGVRFLQKKAGRAM